MATIIVGIDGSENANAALDFATREALRHGAGMKLVVAWETHPALVTSPYNESIEAIRELAEQVARDGVARVAARHPELECESVVVEGQPADMLIRECEKTRDAYMIVVGTRGQGGFASLLLGSVSQQVIHYAKCPVLVVPHPDAAK